MSILLQEVFQKVEQTKKPAFVSYITAGFPTLDETVPILLSMQEGGSDIIELGIPHSDPIGDGATIQHSSTVALQNGVTTSKCLEYVKEARSKGLTVPLVLMTYYNIIHAYGSKKFALDAKESGANGFIIVDGPPEALEDFRQECQSQGLSFIPLIAPTTPNERLKYIDSVADSFIYCVSLLGVTGARDQKSDHLPAFVERIRQHVTKPIAIGFGVSTREMKDEYSHLGQGVVVGSVFVKIVEAAEKGKAADAVREKVRYFTENTKPVADGWKTKGSNTSESVADKKSNSTMKNNFGDFGGCYVPESLMGALNELEVSYNKYKDDPEFKKEVESYYSYVGRPTPLYFAERLSNKSKGAKIWLKREDLSHTGAHKINNAIGQAILAKRMGKNRIIAETGAGQHGVATATICAKMGLECVVYMGSVDIERQSLNVFKMKMLGAKVVPVTSGSKTLKDAINEAMRDWVTNITNTHYLVGSAIGPHPFPTIVRDFQSVIGKESRKQSLDILGKLPDAVVACVGGGSNAIGMFHPFVQDSTVKIYGVEAAGHGISSTQHCATIGKGTPGVLHGTRTLLLQDGDGQISETHSVSAGLDYPGVGPEHAWLHSSGRATYVSVDDKEALNGFKTITSLEGIIPALESSHALAYVIETLAPSMKPDQNIVICLSGRGDKDMHTVAQVEGVTLN
eukprot:TRINITY_DN8117_c0_g1_i1.p1 TRINITY_DN8117_c0_g1~~TRINITY_DN8117_c0_g1_i1.p1  ORF type:complete len:683 (+),score=125.07 TRINITY_DN8117_c0_g1_i1:24-2072(+)